MNIGYHVGLGSVGWGQSHANGWLEYPGMVFIAGALVSLIHPASLMAIIMGYCCRKKFARQYSSDLLWQWPQMPG